MLIPEDEERESEKERNFKLFAATRSHQDSSLGQQHFVRATNTIFALNGGAAVAMLALYENLHERFLPLFSMVFAAGEVSYLVGAVFATFSIRSFERSISIWATLWENAALHYKNKDELDRGKMRFEGTEYEGGQLAGLSGECIGAARRHYKHSLRAFLLATILVSAAFISVGLLGPEKSPKNPEACQAVASWHENRRCGGW